MKRFIEIASSVSHVEVTNLVIPGLNDAAEDFEDLVEWLAGVSVDIPLHFSRFFPQYRMNDRPADAEGNARDGVRDRAKRSFAMCTWAIL